MSRATESRPMGFRNARISTTEQDEGLQLDALHAAGCDRLGRPLHHLIDIVTDLERRGVTLVSLSEQVDTSSPSGRSVFHVFAAMAEFERDLIRERTRPGLAAVGARGRQSGLIRRALATVNGWWHRVSTAVLTVVNGVVGVVHTVAVRVVGYATTAKQPKPPDCRAVGPRQAVTALTLAR